MSILSMLHNSGATLNAFTRVLQATQNNVANVATPGYARQRQQLSGLPFDPAAGGMGGVRAGELMSARDAYSEEAVRRETSGLGSAQQSVSSLSELNTQFDISGGSGLPYALNRLYSSFSAWSQNPGDAVARQTVIERASDAADAFRQTAAGISRTSADAMKQIGQTVDVVNALSARIAEYNRKAIGGGQNDAALDAARNAALEELSQYVGITVTRQGSGGVTVLLDGQIPLVMDARQFEIGSSLADPPEDAAYIAVPRQARIVAGGSDVTEHVTAGRLAALLEMRNETIPSYIGDSSQPGDLNVLAKSFASRVNDLLTGGWIAEGTPPEAGIPLFTYNAEDDSAVAASLQINPAITKEQLAAIEPGDPPVSNGIPLRLSALGSPQSTEDELQGASFMGFYGQLAARAGSKLSSAEDRVAVQQASVAQAKNLRQQTSGVSLDEEAMILVEFQRAYQANSKLFSVLDELTQEAISMLRG